MSKIIIRISDCNMAFATIDEDDKSDILFEPYQGRSGVTAAANLREAFRNSELLQQDYSRATVLLDTKSMVVPLEEYQDGDLTEQYRFVYPATAENCTVEAMVLPGLNSAVAFAVSRDLMTVLNDHFSEVRVMPLMTGVWEYLSRRNYNLASRKLFAYFHDEKMDVCAFARNRFTFVNCLDGKHIHDSVYYLLGIWQHMGMEKNDELYFCGNSDITEMSNELKQYFAHVYKIIPSADFNRHPATQVEGMPLDMIIALVNF